MALTKTVTTILNGRELRLSNLDKPLWPEGYKKAAFLDYLQSVAPFALHYLANRPLVVTRYPDGIEGKAFYQKDCPDHAPDWIRLFPYFSKDSNRWIRFVVCDDEATLVWLGNLACLELHPWLSRVERPLNPDRMIFDLDPSPPAAYEDARRVAFAVREALRLLGLKGYPKTSGATGIHIYVPVLPKYSYRETSSFVRAVAELLRRQMPDLITLERVVNRRTGKVYIDYLQNLQGKTIVAPYSTRPLAGAPVSCPLSWDELESAEPGDLNMFTVPLRLSRRGDPFSAILGDEQDLDAPMKRLGLEVSGEGI